MIYKNQLVLADNTTQTQRYLKNPVNSPMMDYWEDSIQENPSY